MTNPSLSPRGLSKKPIGPSLPRTVARPTAIPGVERKRIEVVEEDLRPLAPHVSRKIMQMALREIGMFVAETASERQVVLWGHEAQRRHASLVSRAVELSQDPVLTRVAIHVRRMTEILASIDVEAASGVVRPKGILDHVLRRTNDRIDTAEELERARVEIDRLVTLTGGALGDLLSLRKDLDRHRMDVADAAEAIEVAALSATFLSERLKNKRDDLSRRFLERAMSLTRSLAQIREGEAVVDVQADQPLRLVVAVQEVVLVALPALLGSFAAIQTAVRAGGRLNPTEATELSFRIRDILRQLET